MATLESAMEVLSSAEPGNACTEEQLLAFEKLGSFLSQGGSLPSKGSYIQKLQALPCRSKTRKSATVFVETSKCIVGDTASLVDLFPDIPFVWIPPNHRISLEPFLVDILGVRLLSAEVAFELSPSALTPINALSFSPTILLTEEFKRAVTHYALIYHRPYFFTPQRKERLATLLSTVEKKVSRPVSLNISLIFESREHKKIVDKSIFWDVASKKLYLVGDLTEDLLEEFAEHVALRLGCINLEHFLRGQIHRSAEISRVYRARKGWFLSEHDLFWMEYHIDRNTARQAIRIPDCEICHKPFSLVSFCYKCSRPLMKCECLNPTDCKHCKDSETIMAIVPEEKVAVASCKPISTTPIPPVVDNPVVVNNPTVGDDSVVVDDEKPSIIEQPEGNAVEAVVQNDKSGEGAEQNKIIKTEPSKRKAEVTQEDEEGAQTDDETTTPAVQLAGAEGNNLPLNGIYRPLSLAYGGASGSRRSYKHGEKFAEEANFKFSSYTDHLPDDTPNYATSRNRRKRKRLRKYGERMSKEAAGKLIGRKFKHKITGYGAFVATVRKYNQSTSNFEPDTFVVTLDDGDELTMDCVTVRKNLEYNAIDAPAEDGPVVNLESEQRVLPTNWPDDVRFSNILDWKTPAVSKHRDLLSYHYPNPLVEIREIVDIDHPAFGQYGCFAAVRIKSDTRIGMYTGRVVLQAPSKSHYIVPLDNGLPDCPKLDVDAEKVGNEMRFINDYHNTGKDHNAVFLFQSCDSHIHGEVGIAVVATRDIEVGEEVLLTYGDEYWATINANSRKPKS